MTCGALVLAAGYSRRFGGDKRLFPVGGLPMLARTLENVRAANLPLRLCLRPGERDLPALLGINDVECIECAGAAAGMGATLANGVAGCGDWDGLLVVLGDMPWVAPATYAAVAAATARDRIVQPCHAGRPGHPVGFGAEFFPELAALDGDRGGRVVIDRHVASLRQLEVVDPGIYRDMDESPEQR